MCSLRRWLAWCGCCHEQLTHRRSQTRVERVVGKWHFAENLEHGLADYDSDNLKTFLTMRSTAAILPQYRRRSELEDLFGRSGANAGLLRRERLG